SRKRTSGSRTATSPISPSARAAGGMNIFSKLDGTRMRFTASRKDVVSGTSYLQGWAGSCLCTLEHKGHRVDERESAHSGAAYGAESSNRCSQFQYARPDECPCALP